MGFNMSGSEVGRGECLQLKGVRPGACSPGKIKFSFLELEEAISRLLTQVFLTN